MCVIFNMKISLSLDHIRTFLFIPILFVDIKIWSPKFVTVLEYKKEVFV